MASAQFGNEPRRVAQFRTALVMYFVILDIAAQKSSITQGNITNGFLLCSLHKEGMRSTSETDHGARWLMMPITRRWSHKSQNRQTRGRDWAKLKSARYFGADFGMGTMPSSSAQDAGQPWLFRAAPAGLARITHEAQM
ncbi:uncharacterized protein TRIREDRAFT_108723 [Trichoderma reesei QM6a]|uniref:Predicted protein n=2 Tax=Hypocrea jecorina TaxID=51453 RepID=G0RMM1_HYPJQ|nr:uncharacterized protein TRIREDRAFT_108723 [Trichoderma reesei QM6a]EGR47501.1 predicted protein [Trichoderma reesei QM6a]ETS00967.1 hypothetical protein M419DRAFT_131127 [Trichoderma reesei RUT C-30]